MGARYSDTVTPVCRAQRRANQREGCTAGAMHGASTVKAVPNTTRRWEQGNPSNQTDTQQWVRVSLQQRVQMATSYSAHRLRPIQAVDSSLIGGLPRYCL